MNLAYLVRSPANLAMRAEIINGLRPQPEYLAYLHQFPGQLIAYSNAMSLESVRTMVLQQTSSSVNDFYSPAPAREHLSVLAACEDIASPLLRTTSITNVDVNIITHGFVFNDPGCLSLLRMLPHVHLLTLSGTIRDRLLDQYKFPRDRVTNTGYGVDLDFFTPYASILSNPHIIVSAGMANRDYKTLVDAVKQVKADLHIAADSAWHPSTPIDIANLILPSQVHVASLRDYASLRSLYARALFIVVPLYPATFASGYAVISEAMAMGKAVIATKTEGSNDFIVDGETGFYVKPRDASDLHEKLSYLLAHPEEALLMGQKGRKRIELFSHREYCRRIFGVIKRYD